MERGMKKLKWEKIKKKWWKRFLSEMAAELS